MHNLHCLWSDCWKPAAQKAFMPQGHIYGMAEARKLLTGAWLVLDVGECIMYKLVLGVPHVLANLLLGSL